MTTASMWEDRKEWRGDMGRQWGTGRAGAPCTRETDRRSHGTFAGRRKQTQVSVADCSRETSRTWGVTATGQGQSKADGAAPQAEGPRRAVGTAPPTVSPEAGPGPALRSDVPPGSKTQLPRLSNSVFSSQMKTCPKHRPRLLPCSLLHLECSAPGHSCMAHNRFYKAVLLPGSFEK